MKKILLLIPLILLSVQVSGEDLKYHPLPDEGVETFVELTRSVDINPDIVRGYLRPGFEQHPLPDAILVRVSCLSNLGWEVHQLKISQSFWQTLTIDGYYYVNDLVADVADQTCKQEWESYYGPRPTYRESLRAWYK